MTAVSVLDDQTAAAIREAMTAARMGRIPEAVNIGERALAGGGDSGALNAMLGTLHCQTGNLAAGIRHLRAARELQPQAIDDIAGNLFLYGEHVRQLAVESSRPEQEVVAHATQLRVNP